MPNESELNLIPRALSGDRRARYETYKKYFFESSRLRRIGSGASDETVFLHDTFTNFLRTGQSWNRQENFAEWVEAAGSWTVLQYQRRLSIRQAAAEGRIRMCAEMEGEKAAESGGAALEIGSYVPPGPAHDSAAAYIFGLLDEPQALMLRTKAVENASWEATAAASGRPLDTVGPLFARALTRGVRLFGAPPPIDDDLDTLFARASADRETPDGRRISIQLDSAFYSLGPEMRRLGVQTLRDARMLVLWNAVYAAEMDAALTQHLVDCDYCASLLDALRILRQALSAKAGTAFLLCPGAYTLTSVQGESGDSPDLLERHVEACPLCASEREQARERGLAAAPSKIGATSSGRKIAWIAAAFAVLLGAGYVQFRRMGASYGDPSHVNPVPEETIVSAAPSVPTIGADPRYRDLVRNVGINDDRIVQSALPGNRRIIQLALSQLALGDISGTLVMMNGILDKGPDPSAELLFAMSLYKNGLISDAYRAMLISEATPPRDTYRCWTMLQFALLVGQKDIVVREVGHLAKDPDYGAMAQTILATVQARP